MISSVKMSVNSFPTWNLASTESTVHTWHAIHVLIWFKLSADWTKCLGFDEWPYILIFLRGFSPPPQNQICLTVNYAQCKFISVVMIVYIRLIPLNFVFAGDWSNTRQSQDTGLLCSSQCGPTRSQFCRPKCSNGKCFVTAARIVAVNFNFLLKGHQLNIKYLDNEGPVVFCFMEWVNPCLWD